MADVERLGGGGATFETRGGYRSKRTVTRALRSMEAKLREAADGMMDVGGGGHDGGKPHGGESRKHTGCWYRVCVCVCVCVCFCDI